MEPWGPDEIARRFDVSRETLARLDAFRDLLLSWQSRINLIGPATAAAIWKRHFADSLQLLPLLPPSAGAIVDLGSGAGFPGLVLAIATGIPVHLFESRAKKAAFLHEAVQVTKARALVHQVRIEAPEAQRIAPEADVVTARALAPLDRLLKLAAVWLRHGAVGLFHKGRDAEREVSDAARSWTFEALRHPSRIDAQGVILELRMGR